jgi:hypothetical protein
MHEFLWLSFVHATLHDRDSCTYTCIHACVRTYIPMVICLTHATWHGHDLCTYTYIPYLWSSASHMRHCMAMEAFCKAGSLSLSACMYVCMNVCMNAWIYTAHKNTMYCINTTSSLQHINTSICIKMHTHARQIWKYVCSDLIIRYASHNRQIFEVRGLRLTCNAPHHTLCLA